MDQRTIQKLLSAWDPMSPFLELSDLDVLKKIGAYSNNHEEQTEGITFGGQDTLAVSQMLIKLSDAKRAYLRKFGSKGRNVTYELSHVENAVVNSVGSNGSDHQDPHSRILFIQKNKFGK